MIRRFTTGICMMIGALTLLATQAVHAQQIIQYTSLDPEALRMAVSALSDSAGTSAMELSGVWSGGINLDDGTASLWQYTFTDPSSGRSRSVAILKTTAGNQYFMSGEFPLPAGTPPPYTLDTTGAFGRSEQITGPLGSNANWASYLLRFPDTGLESIMLNTYTPLRLAVPASFPAGSPVWQLVATRRGDSTMICLVSAETGETRCELTFDTTVSGQIKQSRTGNVQFLASNYGIFGNDPAAGEGGFAVPRGSTQNYIFGAGLWFAGMVRSAPGSTEFVERSFITYDPNSGQSWATPGDGYDREPFSAHPDLYHSIEYDPVTGMKTGLESELNWPLWLSVEEAEATMLEPGRYVALNGARTAGPTGEFRPAFVPTAMEQFTSRYNDSRSIDFTGLEPIGLRVEEQIFVPDESLIDNAVIVQYRVMNVSGDTLVDCAVATAVDFDLLTAANDRAGFYGARPELRSAYATTGSESLPMGTLVMTMIESPVVAEDGFIERGARDSYRDLGTVSTFQSWTLAEDDSVVASRLAFMSTATIDPDLGPGDRRTLLVGETFSMRPGDTAYYAIAYSVLPSVRTIAGTSPELEEKASSLISLYYNGLVSAVPDRGSSRDGSLSLGVIPNPARRNAHLSITLPARSNVRVSISSMIGRELLDIDAGMIESGEHEMALDLGSLEPGLYMVTVTAGGNRRSTGVTIVR